MQILITGATGFIGRALCRQLLEKKHEIWIYTHSGRAAAADFSDAGHVLGPGDLLPEAEVVINLAGASISRKFLGKRRARQITASRLRVLEELKHDFGGFYPQYFMQASACGYYPANAISDEYSSRGDGLIASMCRDLEEGAQNFCRGHTLLCQMRLGIVLGESGGIMPLLRKLPPFKIMGPELTLPWISLEECVRAMEFLTAARPEGPVNLVSPVLQSTNEILSRCRPARWRLPLPALLFRLPDQRGRLLISNQSIAPRKLTALGFKFQKN